MNSAQRAQSLKNRRVFAKKLEQAIKQEAWNDVIAIALGIALGTSLERGITEAQFSQLVSDMWQKARHATGLGYGE